jgi:hypothetical protein
MGCKGEISLFGISGVLSSLLSQLPKIEIANNGINNILKNSFYKI